MVTRSSKSSAEQLVTVREKISLKKFSVAAAGNAAGSPCLICRGTLIVGLDHRPSDSIRTIHEQVRPIVDRLDDSLFPNKNCVICSFTMLELAEKLQWIPATADEIASRFQLTAIYLQITSCHRNSSLLLHPTFPRRKFQVTTVLLPSILRLTTLNRQFSVTQRHLIHYQLFHRRLTFHRKTSIPPMISLKYCLNIHQFSTKIPTKCLNRRTIMSVRKLLMMTTTFLNSTIS